MNTIEKIRPCVCVSHVPTAEDPLYYGMPQLRIYVAGNKIQYSPKCPACGRGGMLDFPTATKAIRYWNELQEKLWQRYGGKPCNDACLDPNSER